MQEEEASAIYSLNWGWGDFGWDLPEPQAQNAISLWPCSLGLAITWLACVQLPGTQRVGHGRGRTHTESSLCKPLPAIPALWRFSLAAFPHPTQGSPDPHWPPIPLVSDPLLPGLPWAGLPMILPATPDGPISLLSCGWSTSSSARSELLGGSPLVLGYHIEVPYIL